MQTEVTKPLSREALSSPAGRFSYIWVPTLASVPGARIEVEVVNTFSSFRSPELSQPI